jgi:hypothetical protein
MNRYVTVRISDIDDYYMHEGSIPAWSNEYGWVDLVDADVFTEREYWTLNLPIGGVWVQLPAAIFSSETGRGI